MIALAVVSTFAATGWLLFLVAISGYHHELAERRAAQKRVVTLEQALIVAEFGPVPFVVEGGA